LHRFQKKTKQYDNRSKRNPSETENFLVKNVGVIASSSNHQKKSNNDDKKPNNKQLQVFFA
jgi:hypothetical protein